MGAKSPLNVSIAGFEASALLPRPQASTHLKHLRHEDQFAKIKGAVHGRSIYTEQAGAMSTFSRISSGFNHMILFFGRVSFSSNTLCISRQKI